MNYIQNYIAENFIFLITIISTYFIAAIRTSIDKRVRIHIMINMSLLLFMSINNYCLDCLEALSKTGYFLLFSQVFYYCTKPLPMMAFISLTGNKIKRYYLPAIINAICYIYFFFSNHSIYANIPISTLPGIWKYGFIITEWIYWIIFLSILNMRYYRKKSNNTLGIFLYMCMLITASIMEDTNMYPGILIKTYAIAFLLYYLMVHVEISQQLNDEKDLKLREQRLSMMLSQIQPHFLYNTLNTIAALCLVEPKLAEETTIKFSKYLRENMHSMGKSDTHPFVQELEHIKIYLEIEKLRFGDRLKVEYDICSTDFDVPVLTLQPIVENAVKHGICKRIEGGIVRIESRKEGRDHIITISDNGDGFALESTINDGKEHVGIHNAQERLKSTLNADMKIDSWVGIGTKVTITIPGEAINIKQLKGDRREIHSIGR